MGRGLAKFRLALLTSLSHDVFGTAKGAAYSAILCLFPTILVLTTLLALTPESDTLRGEMRAALGQDFVANLFRSRFGGFGQYHLSDDDRTGDRALARFRA